MRKQVVIIGATPLCLFLAEALDKHVARLVHADVRWLTSPGQVVPLSLTSTALGKSPSLARKLDHVRVSTSAIKSISLPDRRIVTANGVINYDWLLIDHGQAMTDHEMKLIKQEVKKLMASLQASINTKQKTTAAITVSGNSAVAAQLAVHLARDLRQHPAIWRRIQLYANATSVPERLKTFLKRYDITLNAQKSDRPGLQISTSRPIIDNKKIRGLKIDRSGRAVTDGSGRIEAWPEVMILDSADRPWQTLLRFERTLAHKIAESIEDIVEGSSLKAIEIHGQAVMIAGDHVFVKLGSLTSTNLRSKVVRALEHSFLAKRQ